MTEWGRHRYITPGVVFGGELITTDLVEINLMIRILLGSSYFDDWTETERPFVTQDPLGNPVDPHHPWNKVTIPKPQKRDFADKYSWVVSPRMYDKRTDTHVCCDTGGGPFARQWCTAKAGLVDFGYAKATGESIQMVLPKTANSPEMELEWKVPEKSNAIERDRARTYHQAYSALIGLHCLERAFTEVRAGRTKSWNDFKVPQEAVSVGFHEAARGVLSHHMVIRDGKIANYQPYPPTPWNASVRDVYGTPGPYEDAVQNTPIFEENGPENFKGVDIMRAVRSFDPCLPCGVHMYTGGGLGAQGPAHAHRHVLSAGERRHGRQRIQWPNGRAGRAVVLARAAGRARSAADRAGRALPDPAARQLAEELVGGRHRALRRGARADLRRDRRRAASAQALGDRLVGDGVVASLMLIHDLYPVAARRARRRGARHACARTWSRTAATSSCSGSSDGIARIRLEGSCEGCPASASTLELAIKTALDAAAPDLEGLVVEGAVAATPATPGPARSSSRSSRSPRRAEAPSAWIEVDGVEGLAENELTLIEVEGTRLVVARARGQPARLPRFLRRLRRVARRRGARRGDARAARAASAASSSRGRAARSTTTGCCWSRSRCSPAPAPRGWR